MTKESSMTNAGTSARTAVPGLSSGLRRFLVISASSLVIHLLVFAIRLYRWTIAPAQVFLSQYAMDAVQEHGALAGSALAAKRICRCHPWGGCGHDPVPKAEVRSEKVEGRIVLGTAR
jgi:putative component of membrane protein insertase Oxa1/YidC/SpoIIIJ protein YidD